MAILFAGSAPDALGGTAQVDTSLIHRDPDFVPVGSKFTGGFADSGVGFSVVTPVPTGKYWFHARFRTHSQVSTRATVDGRLVEFRASDDAFIGSVDVRDGGWRLESETGTTTTMPTLIPDTNYVMDISLDISAGNYTMELYFGGALQATLTWASSLGRPTKAIFDFDDTASNNLETTWYCSEVIVTDGESTIGWRLATLVPAADGFYTDWQGDYTGIKTLGDGQGISTDMLGAKQSWTFGTLPAGVSGSAAIRGVLHYVNAAPGTVSGLSSIVPLVRISGAGYDGPVFTVSGGGDLVVVDQNPATGAAWTVAELANLEVGVKASS